jgi:3D-(3,5/4)-trihydroxycyclohexane-1,2-dione acylhydrolase (decyclizing)
VADAAALLKSAERPMIIAGGGVQYSGAVARTDRLRRNARRSPWSRPSPGAPTCWRRIRSTSAPSASPAPTAPTPSPKSADVVLPVGTRLQDFTTGSWTAFAKDAKFIGLNAARHDAASICRAGGGRREARAASAGRALAGYKAPEDWTGFAQPSARPGTPTSPRT